MPEHQTVEWKEAWNDDYRSACMKISYISGTRDAGRFESNG